MASTAIQVVDCIKALQGHRLWGRVRSTRRRGSFFRKCCVGCICHDRKQPMPLIPLVLNPTQ